MWRLASYIYLHRKNLNPAKRLIAKCDFFALHIAVASILIDGTLKDRTLLVSLMVLDKVVCFPQHSFILTSFFSFYCSCFPKI